MLGNEDDLSSNSHQRTSTIVSAQNRSESAKNMFELDTLISNVFNGTDTYMSTDGTSHAMEPTNSAIAKDMNSSVMQSITQNSQNSNSALKNDVKLSEYSEFAPCYAAMQSHQQQQQMQPSELHSASMSQTQHSQSNTNDSNHLSKMFGDDDTSMLLNNNNGKSMQNADQQTHGQLPSTPQPNRIRNSLISDIVNFSPMNGIISQDNASGEFNTTITNFYAILLLLNMLLFSILLVLVHGITLVHKTHGLANGSFPGGNFGCDCVYEYIIVETKHFN